MIKLIAQRLALGVMTLFAASVLIFAGTEILPGDLASAILQNNATPESLASMRKELGLDRPAPTRYVEWLSGTLHGDLGHSLANKRSVAEEIAPRLRNTIFLAVYAALIAVPLAVGLGLLARGASRLGETVRAYDPLREEDVAVEVVWPVFVDPEGVRLHG